MCQGWLKCYWNLDSRDAVKCFNLLVAYLFQVDAEKHTMAKYFMELTLVDYESVHFLPSQIAAAALYLSIKCIDNSEWVTCFLHFQNIMMVGKYSGTSLSDHLTKILIGSSTVGQIGIS